ncbi:MAG: hypothetical protein Q8R42_02105, partial [Desulfocapsaceae bacterium]|nr:hypothetical protein [Desulfocapsaceae bacterium]
MNSIKPERIFRSSYRTADAVPAVLFTAPYAASKKQQSFPAVSWSGVWQITASGCKDQPVKRNAHAFFTHFFYGFL